MKKDTPITSHLMDLRKAGKIAKPSLVISASMDAPYPGDPKPDEYQKKEMKRIKAEVAAMTEQIKNWDADAVANQALKSLKTELAIKKARLSECEARMGHKTSRPSPSY